MKSGRNPLILAAILIVAAVALFLVLKPGDSGDDAPVVTNSATGPQQTKPAGKAASKPEPAPVPTVIVKNGEPVDGVLGIEVDQGDRITFKVESDVDEEIHVHGFDISKDVAAGGSSTLSFKADITGIYEAELEHSGVPIVKLQINP
ncbi:MAG TPA: hypothetical protein VMF31_08595 [Solirubrobacterales bacterium]|nr:hypothetical protein [Solirubrobacterales bacterium]